MLSASSGISDGSNVQNEETVWAPLSVKPYTVRFSFGIYPNPYNVTHPMENSDYYSKLQYTPRNSRSTAITVKPKGSRKFSGELSGTVSIYDALGNIITQGSPMTYVPASTSLVWEFDGTTSRGREIASGSYHVVVVVSSSDMEKPQKMTAFIGVKQ
jgi:hypothetical protein